MYRMVTLFVLGVVGFAQQDPSPGLSSDQKELFLKTAQITRTYGAKKGVTGTSRARLELGGMAHDASVQTIDDEKAKYETPRGTEMGFRDCYKFNIAAYQVAKMLGLEDMVPPSVDRSFEGRRGAYTWWVEDVQMDENDRVRKRLQAPDQDKWARQYHIMKVFDQLIGNTDRNQGNILYDKQWRLWMIDHSRAFRTSTRILDRKALERCDRALLDKMRDLDEAKLRASLGEYVRPAEIRGLLARRDEIVKHFTAHPEKLFDFLNTARAMAP